MEHDLKSKIEVTGSPAKLKPQSRLCKNITIHGFCKFENKGCVYRHSLDEPVEEKEVKAGSSKLPEAPKSLFSAVSAAEFVPGSPSGSPAITNGVNKDRTRSLSPSAKIFTLPVDTQATGSLQLSFDDKAFSPQLNTNAVHNHEMNFDEYHGSFGFGESFGEEDAIAMEEADAYFAGTDRIADTTLYLNQALQPLSYHISQQPVPQILQRRYVNGGVDRSQIYNDENLRVRLLQRAEELWSTPSSEADRKLPVVVDSYQFLQCLSRSDKQRSGNLGVPHKIYRAVHSQSGHASCLLRLENFRLNGDAALKSLEKWRRFVQSNLLPVKEAFTTSAFGDKSFVVVYDFMPGLKSLFSYFIEPNQKLEANSANSTGIPEPTIWNIMVQLISALKFVHENNSYIGNLDCRNILWNGTGRLYLSKLGVSEVVKIHQNGGEVPDTNLFYQQNEDLRMLGHVIVALATAIDINASANQMALSVALQQVERAYSHDLQQALSILLRPAAKSSRMRAIDELILVSSSRTLALMDENHRYIDDLEANISRELENGRLFRLICKLCFINERPEFDMDPQWSETGDRYLLKLFRDYVFHQVDETGQPNLDMGHVLQCLNKLDAGSSERLMLMSRDEQSCLIPCYKDLKKYLDSAFKDLARRK